MNIEIKNADGKILFSGEFQDVKASGNGPPGRRTAPGARKGPACVVKLEGKSVEERRTIYEAVHDARQDPGKNPTAGSPSRTGE